MRDVFYVVVFLNMLIDPSHGPQDGFAFIAITTKPMVHRTIVIVEDCHEQFVQRSPRA